MPTELGVMVLAVVAWGYGGDGGDVVVVATAADGVLPAILLGCDQSSLSALTTGW